MKDMHLGISHEESAQEQGADRELPTSIVQASAPLPNTPLLDFAMLLAARRRLLLWATLVSLVLGVTAALLTKPVYTAMASIMPPQAPQSSLSALMGQLGGLAALGGGGILKNPSDLYVGILQSRTISDEAIHRFHLDQRWHIKSMIGARGVLASHAQFETAKDGIIQISVKAEDPQLASELANFFVDALYGMNSTLAISEASQRRLFFEQQLSEEKAEVVKAEDALKATQQKTGLLTIAGQTELAVRNVAQTRAQISSREVELQGLRTYSADTNPDVQRVQRELDVLRGQLGSLENAQKSSDPGSTEISASQVPGGSLEYARALREVKYHETLLELLSRQYEAARLDEAKSAPVIQVIDRAVPPDQKSGPPRKLIMFGTTILGFLLACAYIFLGGALRHAQQQPATAHKLKQLRDYLPWSA